MFHECVDQLVRVADKSHSSWSTLVQSPITHPHLLNTCGLQEIAGILGLISKGGSKGPCLDEVPGHQKQKIWNASQIWATF